MSEYAFITLSAEGAELHRAIDAELGGVELFVHESAAGVSEAPTFTTIHELTHSLFPRVRGLIFAAPCGVVVRAITGCLRGKLQDPAVVVLDVRARWCISLLSGHEGGANDLALRVANCLGAEPIITTTTEAVKDVIVGVGCRRGESAARIVAAVLEALRRTDVTLDAVRLLASAGVKAHEAGLHEAARELGLALRFVASEEIRQSSREFAHSAFVESKVSVPAVAEPAALLAGRRTRLLLPKTNIGGVTVAVARECSTL